MPISIAGRLLGIACLVAVGAGASASAKEVSKAGRTGAARTDRHALIVTRVWKDGSACPTGVARLRPFRGGRVDMSRFVEIGYVTPFDGKPQLQAQAEAFKQVVTLNFSSIIDGWRRKDIAERFVPIAPGTYVMTSITCTYGNGKSWMGADHPNLFSAESGLAIPIKGDNIIDVRPGEILDAGIVEIHSDKVGFFQRQTGSVVAMSIPDSEEAQLREAFHEAGKRLRFSTFRKGPQ